MRTTLVFTFAVAPECAKLVDAALRRVLGRQLPRALVAALNAGEDHGARFFPFLGVQDGRRRFFELDQMLPIEHLLRVHSQKGVAWLVDGCIEREALALRVTDASTGAELLATSVLFATEDPYAGLRRAVFEITGVTDLRCEPPAGPSLYGRALECLWLARDDLLGLEANLVRGEPETFFSAIEEAMRTAPHEPEVRSLCTEIAARLLATGTAQDRIARCLVGALDGPARTDADFLAKALPLATACGGELGARFADALAEARPGDPKAALAAARARLRLGDGAAAAAILDRALGGPDPDPQVLAERAIVAGLAHDDATRDRLLQALAGHTSVPTAVVLPVVEYLVRIDRLDDAARQLGKALLIEPRSIGLRLEAARIALLRDDTVGAERELAACRAARPSTAVLAELDRLARFVTMPDALRDLRAIESAIARGAFSEALPTARRLVRRHAELAEGWLLLGIVRSKLGHRWRAARAFGAALQRDALLGEAHHRLGMLWLAAGKAARSVEPLRRAGELMPQESAPRLHLAQACALLGNYADGRKALDRAVELGAARTVVDEVRQAFFADAG